MTDDSENKAISSIIERLDRIEAEISQIKKSPTSSGKPVQPRVEQTASVKPPPEKKENILFRGSETAIGSAIGTKWAGRVGMVALIFGIAFFLKYSFDNRLIGEMGRIILGIISGISFLALPTTEA